MMSFFPIFLLVLALFAVPIYFFTKRLTTEGKEKIARKKQHLMFNQLKKGDFIWTIYEHKINAFVITSVEYRFNIYNGKCKDLIIKGEGVENDFVDCLISIPIEKIKTFKFGSYYTLFGEANITAKSEKLKKDKEIEKVSSFTVDDIIKASEEVKERLEKLVKNTN